MTDKQYIRILEDKIDFMRKEIEQLSELNEKMYIMYCDVSKEFKMYNDYNAAAK